MIFLDANAFYSYYGRSKLGMTSEPVDEKRLKKYLDQQSEKSLPTSVYIEIMTHFRNNPKVLQSLLEFRYAKGLPLFNNIPDYVVSEDEITSVAYMDQVALKNYADRLLKSKIQIESKFTLLFFEITKDLYAHYKLEMTDGLSQKNKDAKIFDFTYSPEKIKEDEYSIVADLHRISEEFSKPNFGDQIEYAPTQFLCEYIKRLGFDGIKFKSAVSATGTNVLLFDVNAKTRVYDITGSKVYTVNTLDIDISQVMPMENEDKEQPQMLFICYPKCSTCQKAKKWLDEHNIKYTERHIVEVNPTYDELKEWYGKSGLTLKKFFNTSGLLYKEMQLKDKLPTMSEEEQLQLLATNGMLVKRPLVVNGDTVLVGFKEAEWAEKLN